MFNNAGIAELLLAVLIAVAAFMLISLAMMILYILTLYRSLKITEEHHSMSPGLAWLLLVPIFNLGWQFYVLNNTTRGIRGKFAANGRDCGDAANNTGLAYCLLGCANCVPYLNIFTFVPCFIIWIIYWIKIAGINRDMLMMQF